jgi:NAD(P)-dependent dehydrogenase (short-subunit alcohol dehydrogenase family)
VSSAAATPVGSAGRRSIALTQLTPLPPLPLLPLLPPTVRHPTAGEFATPADIGALAVFLSGEHARQITGATLPVDGAWLAQ